MGRFAKVLAFGLLAASIFGGSARAEDKKDEATAGNIYEPSDGKSFPVTDKDIVRFKGPSPGSTGIQTTVKVMQGEAEVVQRAVYGVKEGQIIKIGGGSLEFDVVPKAGKKGKVKVKVTTTPPGGKTEEKEFEFEVK